ncbi:hypothetical protein [Mesorhizobium sp. M0203]|uniref:hypothetical protein n=1 Tax=Mesorhizobium sp. M0203 TaxID=2956912 RepID=UPI003335B20B
MEFVIHTALLLELKLDALRLEGIRIVRAGGTLTGGAATLIISLHDDDNAISE